jgi:hypothetical protein
MQRRSTGNVQSVSQAPGGKNRDARPAGETFSTVGRRAGGRTNQSAVGVAGGVECDDRRAARLLSTTWMRSPAASATRMA